MRFAALVPVRRLLLVLLLSFSAFAPVNAQSTDQDAIFRQFLEWLRSQPRDIQNAPDPKASYCAFLDRLGLGKEECDRRWGVSIQRVRQGPEGLEVYFDKTYASPGTEFKATPNAFLVSCARTLKPGRALDIHMGQGRNALHLAAQGWDVTGFDISEEGLVQVRAEAAKRGLRIKAVHQDHKDFDFGRSQWDLVVMSYTMIPLDDVALVKRIVDSMKPGGFLVLEHHLESNAGDHRPGDWLPRRQELPTIFRGLKVVKYDEVTAEPDWGGAKAEVVVRMLAQRE
jgi:SAM-dependent methyltransferase